MEALNQVPPRIVRDEAYFRLRGEVEELFFDEASMLDERRFEEWLDLLHEDIVYFMPMRRNVKFGMHMDKEDTLLEEGISWFNEDKWTLRKRVEQILTGVHYAEEPLSRISHLITNVQVRSVELDSENEQDIQTSCRFLVYQNRVEHEQYSFVGRRYDRLVRVDGELKVRERRIILDQNVLLAKCLTAFF